MKLKASLGLIIALLFSSCAITLRTEEVLPVEVKEKTIVTPVTDDVSGIVYSLPKTGLRFYVTAQKVEKTRGEFYLYSERYLGLQDVILEDAVEWEISSIRVAPFGTASADEMFQIVSSEYSSMPLVQLSEEGVLLSVNANATLETEETESLDFQPSSKAVVPYTEEMLLANSSAKMAQEAANYIYRLRESRTALLSADLEVLPPDGEAYAMSLEEIDNLEAQFLSLFAGSEVATTVTEVVEIVPEALKAKQVLFRFSTFGGVVGADDLSGSPYFLTMKEGPFNAPKAQEVDSAGLYYKMPAPVNIQVLDGSTEVLSQKILMGQFGELQTLPAHLLNDEVKIQLYPTTGGLKSIMK